MKKLLLTGIVLATVLAAGQSQVQTNQIRSATTLSLIACGVPTQSGIGPVTCQQVNVPGMSLSYVSGVPTVSLVATAPPPPNYSIVIDPFVINCSTSTFCTANVPQAVFKTSQPVTGQVVVSRAIVYAAGVDYTVVVNTDGTVSVTFNSASQPQDGDVVNLIYMVKK